ncbi:MAG: MBL fold metallo-hydrolase [Oscillospiraceae bacterium]|nr:MBL fold metallo-hydrolase [Oscillospiraceae bacterium]
MITLHTIASGSEGNCLLLEADGTRLLLDAGISCRRICAALDELGLSARELDAVLITHAHSDHTAGLDTLCRRFDVPLYASAPTARQICYRTAGLDRRIIPVAPGDRFSVGAAEITVFPLSHDAAGAVDYRVDCGGASFGALTDTGVVTDEARSALEGVSLLLLESNHDVELLRSGPYPYPLKERILSAQGHLCNADAAAFAAHMARCGTRQFVLAHLSKENNTPVLALEAVCAALEGTGAAVDVAPRGAVSRAYTAEAAICKR